MEYFHAWLSLGHQLLDDGDSDIKYEQVPVDDDLSQPGTVIYIYLFINSFIHSVIARIKL